MLRGKIWQTQVLVLIAVACANCLPTEGDEPKSSAPDNSGRRIAQVIPAVMPAAAFPVGSRQLSGASANWTAALDRLNARANQAAAAAGQRLARLSPPLELTPAAKEALLQSASAAQELSRLAAKRLANIASWGAVLFNSLNDVPRLTPATSVAPLSADRVHTSAGAARASGSQPLL